MVSIKPVVFLGSARRCLAAFPEESRRMAGFQLDRVQRGLEPFDWKPMSPIGPGVVELRIRGQGRAFRVVYVATLPGAIYVLHAFEKKTRKTSRLDVELARVRFAGLLRDME